MCQVVGGATGTEGTGRGNCLGNCEMQTGLEGTPLTMSGSHQGGVTRFRGHVSQGRGEHTPGGSPDPSCTGAPLTSASSGHPPHQPPPLRRRCLRVGRRHAALRALRPLGCGLLRAAPLHPVPPVGPRPQPHAGLPSLPSLPRGPAIIPALLTQALPLQAEGKEADPPDPSTPPQDGDEPLGTNC